jgi:uncharacterized repeat protein (TIGR03803 family)
MNKKPNIFYVIVVTMVLAQTGLRAQTFSDLYDFNNIFYSTTNQTQFQPVGNLVVSTGVLYGTAGSGGLSPAYGGVYSINSDGTGFKTLYNFDISPADSLTLLSGILYAPTYAGAGTGNIISLSTNGGPAKLVYQFTGKGDGAFPIAITSYGNMLYGTTLFSNSYSGPGTIYSIDTNGDNFTVLHTFDQLQGGEWLTISSGTLYGSAENGNGGSNPSTNDILFSISTDGENYTNLYTFTDGTLAGWLIIDQGMLYGIGQSKVVGGYIFSMETNGSNFSVLHVFTNSTPNDLIMLDDNLLCGTSTGGGLYDGGTIFSMKTDGSGYNVLYNVPEYGGMAGLGASGLVSNGDTLLGTIQDGGTNGWGSIYGLNLAPTIQSVTSTNEYLNMVWNAASGAYYQIQYSTNITCTNWLDLGGIFTATNQTISIADPIIGTQRFYRLIYQPYSN